MDEKTFVNKLECGLQQQSIQYVKEFLFMAVKYFPPDTYDTILALLDEKLQDHITVEIQTLRTHITDLQTQIEEGDYELQWEEDYIDHDGLYLEGCDDFSDTINALVEGALLCMRHHRYDVAQEIFDVLLWIEIPVEYCDPVELETILEYGSVPLSYPMILEHAAYTALVTQTGEKRVQLLYEIFKKSHATFSLSKVLALGAPLSDERTFSKEWVAFLLQQPLGWRSDVLLDAVQFDSGLEGLKALAYKHGTTYMKSYLLAIQQCIQQKQYVDGAKLAEDALSKIKEHRGERTVIAQLLQQIGQETNNPQQIQQGLMEAFCSSFQLSEYIQLYALNNKDILQQMLHRLDTDVLKKDDDYYAIHFLHGNYEMVWDICKKDNQPLGWSQNIKGRLMPFFLALLEGQSTLMPCTRDFLQMSIGLDQAHFAQLSTLLCPCLQTITQEQQNTYLTWVLKETEQRVKAIVSNQYRGSYPKAAALVFSVAEALSILKGVDTAEAFLKSFKNQYPNHRSFRSCLRDELKKTGFRVVL